jgi:hypothetical protein
MKKRISKYDHPLIDKEETYMFKGGDEKWQKK